MPHTLTTRALEQKQRRSLIMSHNIPKGEPVQVLDAAPCCHS
jgi:hypothetical protein